VQTVVVMVQTVKVIEQEDLEQQTLAVVVAVEQGMMLLELVVLV
jgi:hypothetical protein